MPKKTSLSADLTQEMKKNLFGNAYLNMLWHCPSDPRFHYWVHLPDCYYDEPDPHYQLLVIIHGTGCEIEEYIRSARTLADKQHVAILVNRFLFVHPERLKAVSIGAPGRPTFLNSNEDYFWGIRDFKVYFDKDPDLEKICKIPVQITVGERDTAFIGDSPYGSNRLERMKSLKANLEANGLSVCLEILSGLEHGGGEDIRINTAQEFFERYL